VHPRREISRLVRQSELEALAAVPAPEVYAWLLGELEDARRQGALADPEKGFWIGVKLAASGHAGADRAAAAWAAEQGAPDAVAVAGMVLNGLWARVPQSASPDAVAGLLDLLERPGKTADARAECRPALEAVRAHPDPAVAARVARFLDGRESGDGG
jgi:hypothetical protein